MAMRSDSWLRDLYTARWTSMVRLATLMLGSSDQAEEIVQEAMLAVFQRRSQFQTDAHAAAYLRTAVVNRCRSAHRHRVVAQRYRPEETTPTGPEELATSLETHQEVLAALRTLPQRQQEVLILRYYSEASEAEIAQLLGISRGAVKSHAHRGVQSLRGALADVLKEGR